MDAIQSTLDDLFRMARTTDPSTSHAAAADALKSADIGRIIALRAHFEARLTGLTDFELEDKTGKRQTSIGKRRFDCVERGWIVDSGQKRPAPSGSLAIVWRITEAGINYLTGVTD